MRRKPPSGPSTQVVIVYRKSPTPGIKEEPVPPGACAYNAAAYPTPDGAWAWLHTLRTGEVFQNATDVARWAKEERARYKAPHPKPRLLTVPQDDAPQTA